MKECFLLNDEINDLYHLQKPEKLDILDKGIDVSSGLNEAPDRRHIIKNIPGLV